MTTDNMPLNYLQNLIVPCLGMIVANNTFITMITIVGAIIYLINQVINLKLNLNKIKKEKENEQAE